MRGGNLTTNIRTVVSIAEKKICSRTAGHDVGEPAEVDVTVQSEAVAGHPAALHSWGLMLLSRMVGVGRGLNETPTFLGG